MRPMSLLTGKRIKFDLAILDMNINMYVHKITSIVDVDYIDEDFFVEDVFDNIRHMIDVVIVNIIYFEKGGNLKLSGLKDSINSDFFSVWYTQRELETNYKSIISSDVFVNNYGFDFYNIFYDTLGVYFKLTKRLDTISGKNLLYNIGKGIRVDHFMIKELYKDVRGLLYL